MWDAYYSWLHGVALKIDLRQPSSSVWSHSTFLRPSDHPCCIWRLRACATAVNTSRDALLLLLLLLMMMIIITRTINVSVMTASLLRHSSNYDGDSQGKQRLNRCVFRRLRKTDSDDEDVTCCGRLFQTRERRRDDDDDESFSDILFRLFCVFRML